MEIGVVALVVAAVLLASTATNITGFGFALTLMPFLLAVLEVRDAVVVSTLLALATTVLLARRVWGDVPWRSVLAMFAASVVGMPLGLLALLFAPADALALTIGVVTVVMAALLATGARTGGSGRAGELAAGLVSGALRTSTSLDGPPVVLYLQGSGRTPAEFRATLTPYFVAGGTLAVATFAVSDVVTQNALLLALAGVPSVYAGHVLGHALLGRVDAAAFRRIVLALLVATALASMGVAAARLAG